MTQDPAPRRGRGRRPAAVVRREILGAAAATLFEVGLSGVTFEKVAVRAGASKMTLYKWWPSPGALALDAYFDAVEDTLAFPESGDVESDLRTQLRHFVDLLNGEGGSVIADLIGAAQRDPELSRAFSTRYSRPRRRLAVDRFELAQRSGQIRAEVDVESLVDQLWGACYYRLLVPDLPLDHEAVDQMVSNLLHGIAPTQA